MFTTITTMMMTNPPVTIRNTKFRISGSKGDGVGEGGPVGVVVGVGVGVVVVRITSIDSTLLHWLDAL